uniref:Uncharacterized protein n=1 Tax=Bionectria ochroleuca TaxID=29856 RepID=A0A0B7K6E5_BIOOC
MAASMKFLESLFSLAGKTAVITGGSSGIGREMAAALGQAGAQVILLARRQQPLSDTVLDFKKLGIEAHAFSCDATVFGSDEGGGKAEAHARRTMIKRNGVPGDFAGVAVYLASEASAAVTGQTIFVDGGYSAT